MAEIAGLTLITPSSVAGSGVSLSGAKVAFTGSGTISVNGVFNSTYDNYLVVMRAVCTEQSGWNMRLRANGSDVTGSNYSKQYLYADGTGVAGGRTTSTDNWSVTSFATVQNGLHLYLYGPSLAQPTAMRSVSVASYLNAYIEDWSGTHSLSTAYDGFTIYRSSLTITGALTIYGLSQ